MSQRPLARSTSLPSGGPAVERPADDADRQRHVAVPDEDEIGQLERIERALGGEDVVPHGITGLAWKSSAPSTFASGSSPAR